MTTLKGPLRSAVGSIPETDTAVAFQSSYTKVLAGGFSFQDVCGELVGVGQSRSVKILPLSLIFCGKRFAAILPLTVT